MWKQHSNSAEVTAVKDELSKLRLTCLWVIMNWSQFRDKFFFRIENWSQSYGFCRQMMGQQLDGLSFKDLQHLEHQLSAGILSVKDKKVNKFYNEQLLFCIWSYPPETLPSFCFRMPCNSLLFVTGSNADGSAKEIQNTGKEGISL